MLSQVFAQQRYYALLVIFVFLGLAACSSTPESSRESFQEARIEQFFKKWQGTKYGYGGSSTQAIDCSALMVHAYNELYAINLPRTTESQAKVGKKIRQRNLRAGDLVFFKTGFRKKHVGIYMGDDIFVHASTSAGVIKSSLASEYWSDHYWKSRRVKTY